MGKVSKKEQKELARTQRLLNDNAPITRSVTAAFKEKHVRALPPSPPLTKHRHLGGKRDARVCSCVLCAVSTPSLTCIAALASKRNNSNGASERRAARRLHQHREAPGAARGFGASLSSLSLVVAEGPYLSLLPAPTGTKKTRKSSRRYPRTTSSRRSASPTKPAEGSARPVLRPLRPAARPMPMCSLPPHRPVPTFRS